MRGWLIQWLCSCLMAAILTTVSGGLNGEHDIEKRAPMGFQGVRGKKADSYFPDAITDGGDTHPNSLAVADMIDKRAPMMGFQGVRGKKLFQPDYDHLQRMYELKRAQMGFQGMRGKKDMEILNAGDLSAYEKRAPAASSFMGMRGKKTIEDAAGLDDHIELESALFADEQGFGEFEKRAQMGFQGMRGKKSFEEEKRAPADGFFGVRGKKHPASTSGFFGMRGKKYPYEFRGKFVGVRGKKQQGEIEHSDEGQDDDELKQWMMLNRNRQGENMGNGNDLNQMLFLLADENVGRGPWAKRKGPVGFFGVRG